MGPELIVKTPTKNSFFKAISMALVGVLVGLPTITSSFAMMELGVSQSREQFGAGIPGGQQILKVWGITRGVKWEGMLPTKWAAYGLMATLAQEHSA